LLAGSRDTRKAADRAGGGTPRPRHRRALQGARQGPLHERCSLLTEPLQVAHEILDIARIGSQEVLHEYIFKIGVVKPIALRSHDSPDRRIFRVGNA
jgi:hypothetical protein